MKKLTLKKFQEHLSQLDPAELAAELSRLFKKYPAVKRHYEAELGTDQLLLEKYKKKIYDAYFPKKGPGKRKHANIRKYIGEFKKVAPFELDIIELQLHRVDCALQFFQKQGKQKRAYYDAVLTSFEEAMKLVKANHIEGRYQAQINTLLKKAPKEYDFSARMKAIC